MQPARVARENLRQARSAQPERLRPEVRQLRLRRLGCEQPDSGALLRAGLRQDQRAAALEPQPERRRLRPVLAGAQVAQAARAHQVHHEHELAVVGREEQALRAPLGTR